MNKVRNSLQNHLPNSEDASFSNPQNILTLKCPHFRSESKPITQYDTCLRASLAIFIDTSAGCNFPSTYDVIACYRRQVDPFFCFVLF